MSETTKINWADATWNPVRGCTPISTGCKSCYAKTLAERRLTAAYAEGFALRMVPGELERPLHWKKPRAILTCSMGDLFHENIPMDFITSVFETMAKVPQHTFLVLTKRAMRMRSLVQMMPRRLVRLPHVWLGVSVEDRAAGFPRIDLLRTTPAAKRFLSVAPLLEDLGEVRLEGIDWVVAAGEKGRSPRPVDAAWLRSIRDQCSSQAVPFYFNTWGGRVKREPLLDGIMHLCRPFTYKNSTEPTRAATGENEMNNDMNMNKALTVALELADKKRMLARTQLEVQQLEAAFKVFFEAKPPTRQRPPKPSAHVTEKLITEVMAKVGSGGLDAPKSAPKKGVPAYRGVTRDPAVFEQQILGVLSTPKNLSALARELQSTNETVRPHLERLTKKKVLTKTSVVISHRKCSAWVIAA